MRTTIVLLNVLSVVVLGAGCYGGHRFRPSSGDRSVSGDVTRSEGVSRQDVADWLSANDVCEVHRVKMRAVEIPIVYGHVFEEVADASIAFGAQSPNASRYWILGGCEVQQERSALVYVCPECDRAREMSEAKWTREHGWDPYFPPAR